MQAFGNLIRVKETSMKETTSAHQGTTSTTYDQSCHGLERS